MIYYKVLLVRLKSRAFFIEGNYICITSRLKFTSKCLKYTEVLTHTQKCLKLRITHTSGHCIRIPDIEIPDVALKPERKSTTLFEHK